MASSGFCDERESVLQRRVDSQLWLWQAAVEPQRCQGGDHAWVGPQIGAERAVGICQASVQHGATVPPRGG